MSNGLPSSVDAERFVLGAILLDESYFPQTVGALLPDDFSLESHRRIYRRMGEIHSRREKIDTITVFNELERFKESESCGGLSYLAELSTGIPHVANIDSHVRIVKNKALTRKIIFASQHVLNRAMADEEEPDQLLVAVQSDFVKIAERSVATSLQSPADIYAEAGGISAYLNRGATGSAIETGFKKFDNLTGGLRKSCFYVLGARPRMGKTAWVLNVAENLSVSHDKTTLIFSLEMAKDEIVDRAICARARVNTKRFQSGRLDSDEKSRITAAAGEIGASGLRIDDKAATNMGEIHSKIRQWQARGPVDLVLIDYLQLLIGGDVKNRVAEASKISRDMKLVAKDCKIPLFALSQLNRECDQRDDHRPRLSDIRETGAVEQDADVIAFLYRPEVYDPNREDYRNYAELIVAKQRQGPEGYQKLCWLPQIVKFENRMDDVDYEPYD